MGDEHPKLSSPITEVIELEYVVTEVVIQPGDALSDDGRPDEEDDNIG